MGGLTQVYIRLGGNVFFLLAHVINIIVMQFALQRTIMKEDEELKRFHSLQYKYITIWNLAFQLVHLSMSIVCDLSVVLKMNEKYKIIEQIRRYKSFFFACILWPLTVLIASIFWPIFTYDRELIFPSFIDKVLTTSSNHMMHTFIILVVMWEVMLQPRSQPKSHKWNLMHMAALFVIYMIVILHHYHTAGVWPYPMLNYIYGTIYFPFFIAFIAGLYIFDYYIQWSLYAIMHGSKKSKIR